MFVGGTFLALHIFPSAHRDEGILCLSFCLSLAIGNFLKEGTVNLISQTQNNHWNLLSSGTVSEL